ncbi:acyl carrier protein [Clostridium estertheticum]|uniref:acyl carrier protein n=1 Tax=Clostridium estertheticum TaxID=238834 RepID=UPI0013EE46AC|nr:acyl carrier protein [Clostridium estertheticum]MBZ9609079.1 acyl carrier protein [Clostridium estertheticum]
MKKERIFEIMKEIIVDILPEISADSIKIEDSMKDLGANSIDRFDILADTMEELNIKMPLVKFGELKNLKEVVELFYENIK